MSRISLYGELLKGSEDGRTLSYKLLPFEEPGRTNLGKVRVSKGAVKVPRDISHLILNTEHRADEPVGRFVSIEEADDALYATVHLSEFERGDEALQAAIAGDMAGISVEVRSPVIKAGRLLDGELTGAALCKTPAFSSAMLTASDMGDLAALLQQFMEGYFANLAPDTDADAADEDAEEATEDPAEEATETPAEEAAEESTELPEDDSEDQTPADSRDLAKEQFMSATNAAPAAEMLSAAATGADAAPKKSALVELGEMLTAASSHGATPSLHAAVAQITTTDSYDVTSVPDYVGELWQLDRDWNVRFMNLINQRTLVNKQIKGWKWDVKPVGAIDYSGFPAQIGTNSPKVVEATATASELAAGHELDRITLTLNDGGFVESYLRMCATDWSRQMDLKVIDFLSSNATAVTGAGTDPYGKLITGAQIISDYATPTFAVLGSNAWKTIMTTQNQNVLELLQTSIGLTDGSFENFKIVPAPTFYTGIGKDDVIVGSGNAASLYTLPGGPVRLELADFQSNGILKGLWGAYAFLLHDARGLLKVSA